MLTAESRALDFPMLASMTYLNSAAEGLPSLAVGRALSQYFADHQLGMDGRDLHFAQLNQLKERVGQMYGMAAEQTAVCSCSSEAFNMLSLALNLKQGDEIIINDLDFPAGATPWLLESCPATTRVWKSRQGRLHLKDLEPLLNRNTRLVPVSMVSFFNGFMIDLAGVVQTVRKLSPAMVSVDITQALGRIPLDLKDVDIVVSSTHKWILATHGGGLVGINKQRQDELTPQAGGWFNLSDAFGADRFEKAVPLKGAAGFAVGMPNFPAIYAINAALKYIQDVGVEAIDQYARPLVEQCLAGLKQLPVNIISPDTADQLAGIIAFTHPDSAKIGKALRQQNIHIMEHAGRLRVAIHGYNTQEDIQRLLDGLKGALQD